MLPVADLLRGDLRRPSRTRTATRHSASARRGTGGCGSRSRKRTRPLPGAERDHGRPIGRRRRPGSRSHGSSGASRVGVMAIAHRCPCGLPDVVQTAPRLPDGTPFPTLYYLTCPRASGRDQQAGGGGRDAGDDSRLAGGRRRCAQRTWPRTRITCARRDEAARAAGLEPLPPGTQSAGGMPDRVKCLHALAAHALAVPGVNPLGAEAVRSSRGLVAGWTMCGTGHLGLAGERRMDDQAGSRDRLRDELASAAHRRRRPGRRTLTDVERRMEIVRLGQGVDATGMLAPEALERTLRVLAEYAARDRGRQVRARSGWSPPARPATRVTPRTSPAGVQRDARHRARGHQRRRGSQAVLRRRDRRAGRRRCRSRAGSRPTSWSTSAADRPSSSSGGPDAAEPGQVPASPPSRWTSAASA